MTRADADQAAGPERPALVTALHGLAADPDSPGAWHAVGRSMAAQRHVIEAYWAFAEAVRLLPTCLAYSLDTARAAAGAGQAEAELARAAAVLDAAPADVGALLSRAYLLDWLGRIDDAVAAAEAAVAQAPDAVEPAQLLAELQRRPRAGSSPPRREGVGCARRHEEPLRF